MTALHALILGIVEGFSEFLPISSTGHLLLVSDLLKLEQTNFLKTFLIVIQLGSILSVIVFYWRSLLIRKEAMLRIIAAFIPTAIVGFLLEKVIRDVLFESVATILWALAIGGIILIVFEKYHHESPTDVTDMEKITYTQAFLIGLCQALAVIPGVSRSGATIVGGMLLGVSRKAIVDFSFVLAVPTMLAATLLEIVKHHSEMSFDQSGLLLIGFVTSFVVALLSIKWLLGFIKHHNFVAFGVYRILIALLFFAILR
jgi:undecaprenyl-diphosphatase